ncbi:hypothetical protein, partial [Pseudomonas helleri]|uniref:hypothetical protein n=1 Tax=Pseudomonas helleri TaxID=1608996 RepID=UPI003F9518B4
IGLRYAVLATILYVQSLVMYSEIRYTSLDIARPSYILYASSVCGSLRVLVRCGIVDISGESVT